ncbi:precorrin-3B synthase [Krasilnikovia cinnamomea]|uniref:Precorrin-3B synthase n=1 Tax=Krasilnikovia cinnamomea TaxID=349313 RepID=A0A4Q7ZF23_9ACTN|nr:precorrin-3B synthase [Krasilnikovia cinnamomea]RZU49317.1 precorrin-3B synthase [Krasilnikovia cinnamomea]
MSSPRRVSVDACPGALRLHAAADGPLARVRLPGGRLTGAQVRVLRELADEWGDGHVELTSRGNVQLRALTAAPAGRLAGRLADAGLLPSPTHELVRNIAASPLPGGALDVAPLVGALDRALCADPALAGLPGRFLFALDSGRGDVAFAADVAAYPLGDAVAILFAGVDAGLRVPPGQVVPALLTAAHAFLSEREAPRPTVPPTPPAAAPPRAAPSPAAPPAAPPLLADTAPAETSEILEAPGPQEGHRPPRSGDGTASAPGVGGAWRVRELVDGPGRLAARVAATTGVRLAEPVALERPGMVPPVGLVAGPGGLVSVGAVVPLGRWSAVQMKVLERAATLVVTPWRGVVVPGLGPAEAGSWSRALAGVGLEVAQGSRWAGVTTCAGLPGCAKSLADVRADATRAVRGTEPGAGPAARGCLPVHWVGCARGCGSPAGPHVRVEATGRDYEVRSPAGSGRASADGVADLVATARRN